MTKTGLIEEQESFIENFILQGEMPTTPSKLRFVDFQLSSYDTPVRDLSYFIYSACNKTVLDDFDLLLRKYHSSLSENLKALGCDVDAIFPYTRLEEHWKLYAKFGLVISTMIVKIELLEADEAPDLREISETGADMTASFTRTIKNEEVYRQRMLDLLTHFGNKCL